VFTRLSSQEQEILLRCYVLNQADDQIARSMAVPDSFVNGVRTRVRIAIQNVSESRSAQPDLTV
jgi:DNA-directed RNA polymerase specialized sigma24 family protein